MYSSGGDYWTFSRVAENRRGRGERRRTRKSSHFLIGTLGFAWVLSQYRVMSLRDKFSPPKLPSLCTFQMLAFPLLFKCGPQASFWETTPCAPRGASFLCWFSSITLSKSLRTESEPNSVNTGAGGGCHLQSTIDCANWRSAEPVLSESSQQK